MRDPATATLLSALDGVPSGILLEADDALTASQQRLRAAQRLLGTKVQEGPYLAFLRHLSRRPAPTAPVAVSA